MANKALIVAVSDYSTLDGNRSLTGPQNDADIWQAVLEKSNFGVRTLRDSDATKERFMETAKAMVSVPGSNNIIIFSGHGTRLTRDGRISDGLVMFKPNSVEETDYPRYVVFDSDLPDFKQSIADRARLTLIFDCCYAAGLTNLPIQAAVAAAAATVRRPRFIPLKDTNRDSVLPAISPFAVNIGAANQRSADGAARAAGPKPTGAYPSTPPSEFVINGFRYVLAGSAAPDPRAVDPSLPPEQRLLAFGVGGEPMVIAAAGFDQEAFEVDGLDASGKVFGIFSFFATRELGGQPLSGTDLCAHVNTRINGSFSDQQANTPTRSGREGERFL
ncbi:MAG TPA: caspase family protein [Thermoanaerobaculia bacterium]|nr:caspase family protein [Thermoanaerobaculia bacterium]